MGTEAPAPQGRGWLVALLWLLLLSAGTPGSWPVTSHAPGPAPDQAAAQEPGRPAGGTQRLAPGAVCGKPKVTGRIFGGRNVLAGQWPWQASLLYQRSHLCGAVLIDSLWLVSTAHCFLNKSHDPADYQVLLGSTQLYQHTQHTQEISLSRIIVHPDFEKRHPFGSDIVMLQLHLPLNFTPYIAPACLPSPGMQLSGNLSCWITGWGMLSEDKQLHSPFRLQEGKVGLVGNELCNVLYRQRLSKSTAYSVQDEMLCAGDFSTGKAICQGDSGGPLVCELPTAWVLVGLASWGFDCRHPIYPSVFTRVGYFSDWIHEIQMLTPPPDPTSAPQTPFPGQPLSTASSSGHPAALVPPQTWLLLLCAFRDPQ
ncbi:putative serine protease 47 isoform X1 [Canis lupus baileyi]|uniref:putative serine protease 47 isoform X2 n=1 Tax=Canis lupus familiaris TaxID=9615 RepID=UPI000059FDE1|nr:putative serine protease 47 isoform X2 [Canis lupus familiaris]|eukprot:XP_005616030.2 putative serine protease 47 isoform X1 [Canis lupus familiaris]